MFTFSLCKIKSQLYKKQFQVMSPIESIISGNLQSFLPSVRSYSRSVRILSGDGCRHDDAVGVIVTTAAKDHIGQSNISRDGGGVRRWGGPPAVQGQKHERTVKSELSMRESGPRVIKGHQRGPISNSSRRLPSEFNADVTGMYSSSGGKSSDVDAFVKEWLPGCTVREISNFMRITGKKSRNKSHLHLKRHLPAIASRIESLSSVSWRPIDVSAALYGLQCLAEDDDGYLAVVTSMTAALAKSTRSGEAVASQSISMTLLGLQNNTLGARQSLELLDSITIMIQSCKESLSAQEVGNALYGMQSMSSDHSEVRSMISALSGKVHSCKESLDAQAVGNALYGMQSMSSDHSEVRSMISALSGKVHSCKESLSAQHVGNALYGMQSMSSDFCGEILSFLLTHAFALTEVKRLSRFELLSVGQAVLLCIPSRRDVLDDASYELWTKLGDSVCMEHRRRIKSGEYMDSSRSHVERKVHRVAASLYGQSRATVSSNDYLFEMFESDIVVRIPFAVSTDDAEASADGKWLVINIEVDGVHHRQEKKINFCKLRDAYLKSRGVVVHRIDASRVTMMDDDQLEGWLLDVTAESLLLSACE